MPSDNRLQTQLTTDLKDYGDDPHDNLVIGASAKRTPS